MLNPQGQSSLDSISLRLKDFNSLNEPVYYPMGKRPNSILGDRRNSLIPPYALMSIVCVLLALLFIQGREFNKKLAKITNEKRQSIDWESKSNASKIFDQPEQDVIHQMVENSKLGKTTSIDDLNKALGLLQKSAELQKKYRSDLIISINKKFRFIANTNDLLITKKRSDHDKRSFEYYIEDSKIEDIKGTLNSRYSKKVP